MSVTRETTVAFAHNWWKIRKKGAKAYENNWHATLFREKKAQGARKYKKVLNHIPKRNVKTAIFFGYETEKTQKFWSHNTVGDGEVVGTLLASQSMVNCNNFNWEQKTVDVKESYCLM